MMTLGEPHTAEEKAAAAEMQAICKKIDTYYRRQVATNAVLALARRDDAYGRRFNMSTVMHLAMRMMPNTMSEGELIGFLYALATQLEEVFPIPSVKDDPISKVAPGAYLLLMSFLSVLGINQEKILEVIKLVVAESPSKCSN